MEYYLTLAGLQVKLCTPEEITISDSLRPFLTQPQDKTDCTISVQVTGSLPAVSEGGVWRGAEYHTPEGVVHCLGKGDTPFAFTAFSEEDVTICVLPEFTHYFLGNEGIFNRIGLETWLQKHHGLLLHASIIMYKDRAIAFAGPSGVGKSTQAELWHKTLGAKVINGDRAVLRKTESGWFAYGSPYAGTSGIYCNDSAPLTAVVVLSQGQENTLTRLPPVDALGKLYPEISSHPWDKSFTEATTDLCLELIADVPVYGFACQNDNSAPLALKKGLNL